MAEKHQILLDVGGMTCDSCAVHVTKALRGIKGVAEAHVPGWASSRATVVADPGVGDEVLTATIKNAGYRAKVLTRREITPPKPPEGLGREVDYDLAVIGTGRAGMAAAIRAAELGHATCPTNQQTGKPVDSLTVKALLALPLTQLPPADYHFCQAADCPTVYYSTDGTVRFSEIDLRERVYQKHPTDDNIFVCYCFRHTIGSIRKELEQTGTSNVIAAVTAGIQAGQCACGIRNPQGSCCLGNVRAVVQRLETEIRERSKQG